MATECEDCCTNGTPDTWILTGDILDNGTCVGCDGFDGAEFERDLGQICGWAVEIPVTGCGTSLSGLINIGRDEELGNVCVIKLVINDEVVWTKLIENGDCNSTHVLGNKDESDPMFSSCEYPDEVTLTPGGGAFAGLEWDEGEQLWA